MSFASEFVRALPTGIDLADRMDQQRKTNAARKMGSIMAEMQAYDPNAQLDFPGEQGVPTEGQATAANPNQGFDGHQFESLTEQYYQAAAGLGDIRDYTAAMQVYGQFKMDKVNGYIDAALTAGDPASGARALRAVSAYMSPGVTPEITVDPNSGAYLVANYKDGKPTGGYAVTRDQLMDIRGRNTDFNAWATREMSEQQHNERMGLAYAKFNNTKKMQNAAAARAAAAATTAEEKAQLDIANKRLDQQLKTLQLDTALATHETGIEKGIAENIDATDLALNAPAERQAAKSKASVAAGMEKFEELTQYSTEPSVPVAPGEAAMASGIAPDDGNMDLADQSGLIDAQIASGSGSGGKSSGKAVDPMLYDVAPDGTATLRGGVQSLAASVMADAVNPELNPHTVNAPPEVLASLGEGVAGRSQSVAIREDFDDEGNPIAIADDGVTRINLSPNTYQAATAYQKAMGEIMATARGEQLPQEVPGPNPMQTPGVPNGAAEAAPAIPEPGMPDPMLPPIDDTAAPVYH